MKLTYNGDEPRYYADLGLFVQPGDVVDLDTAPDGRFTEGAQTAPEAPVEPATPEADQTPTN
jgi:hypothetical protein